MSFLCPCRGPGRQGRAAAAGHCVTAEREARGALEMRGAGPRDPVRGAGGSLSPRLMAHLPSSALGTGLSLPSFAQLSAIHFAPQGIRFPACKWKVWLPANSEQREEALKRALWLLMRPQGVAFYFS